MNHQFSKEMNEVSYLDKCKKLGVNSFESVFMPRKYLKKNKDREGVSEEQQMKIFAAVPRKKLIEEESPKAGSESDGYGFDDVFTDDEEDQ